MPERHEAEGAFDYVFILPRFLLETFMQRTVAHRIHRCAIAAIVALLLGGCVDTSPPRQPRGADAQSAPVASETGSSSGRGSHSKLSDSCSGATAVRIAPEEDAARVMRGQGAGTSYLVEAGVHRGNFSVRPRRGDRFCGEPGAVLDGGGTLARAFYGTSHDVVLESMTIQSYDTGRQLGAINPDKAARGWVVRNVTAMRNYWAGLKAADGMQILGGSFSHNGQMGITGAGATDVVLDGLDNDPRTYDGPELANNRTSQADCGFEGGGMKFTEGSYTIRNVHAHDNECKGLWGDIDAHDVLIEYNLIERNSTEGIFFEISRGATIRHNEVHRNGMQGAGWYWGGGITIASSSDVQVYGNALSANYNGITGTQQDRSSGASEERVLDDIVVFNNTICATAGPHALGVAADNGDDLTTRDITFRDNTINHGACDWAGRAPSVSAE